MVFDQSTKKVTSARLFSFHNKTWIQNDKKNLLHQTGVEKLLKMAQYLTVYFQNVLQINDLFGKADQKKIFLNTQDVVASSSYKRESGNFPITEEIALLLLT